jgi:hypothetical protein
MSDLFMFFEGPCKRGSGYKEPMKKSVVSFREMLPFLFWDAACIWACIFLLIGHPLSSRGLDPALETMLGWGPSF